MDRQTDGAPAPYGGRPTHMEPAPRPPGLGTSSHGTYPEHPLCLSCPRTAAVSLPPTWHPRTALSYLGSP